MPVAPVLRGNFDMGDLHVLSADQLLSFLLAVAVIELTPGPNMGYLAIVAGRSGRRAGMTVIAGVTVGLAIYLAASMLGLAEVIVRWPGLLEMLRWAGVAYLLWLAVDTWRDVNHPDAPADDASGLFTRGLLNNLLNPKAAVFYVALLPGFVNPQAQRPLLQALALGGIHIAVSLFVHSAIVWTAARAGAAVATGDDGMKARIWRRAFALALAAMAVWLALTPRR